MKSLILDLPTWQIIVVALAALVIISHFIFLTVYFTKESKKGRSVSSIMDDKVFIERVLTRLFVVIGVPAIYILMYADSGSILDSVMLTVFFYFGFGLCLIIMPIVLSKFFKWLLMFD